MTKNIFKLSDISSLDLVKLIGTILLTVSLPFSESLKTLSMFLILSVFLVQLYRREIKIKLSPIHYGFISLLLSALISSAFAEIPAKALRGAGAKDILFYTIPFFVTCSITDEKRIRVILWSLFISTALAAAAGIFQSILTHRTFEIHSLGNQNYTAMYLIIAISSMIGTIVFSDKETKLQKGVIGILLSLTTIAAIMTTMRSSFLALFIFISILFFSRKRPGLAFFVSSCIVVISSLAIYLYKPMWTKLFTTQSLVSRLNIWQHALDLLKENPVVGIGLNHFQYTFPQNTIEAGATYFDVHNVYLQTASQMGLLGLFSLFLIFLGFIRKWIQFKPASEFQKTVKYNALGGFLVIFVGGILDTTLHHEHAIVFTILIGFMFGIFSEGEKSHENP